MYDVVVIGGGPAGIMGAISAAQNNNKVLLIEKNSILGKKMLITGGGRCNLTNLKDVNDFMKEISVNKNFLKYPLNIFGPKQICEYFTNLGVGLKVEEKDRVFPCCDESSTIVNALKEELHKCKVDVVYNCKVEDIQFDDGYYVVHTDLNDFLGTNIIIATGGKTYPKTGSNGDGYRLAQRLNQPLTELYPAQFALKLTSPLSLSGITLETVKIKLNNIEKEGSMLFTHLGISGPAVFKISEYVYHEFKSTDNVSITINLIPKENRESLFIKMSRYNPKKEIKSFIREILPVRVGDYILNVSKLVATDKLGSISKKDKRTLIDNIIGFKVMIKKDFPIDNSLVTGGGVNLKYIDNHTMESKMNPGIYFVGEILDLHGATGGYDITIALSTGYVAGVSIR